MSTTNKRTWPAGLGNTVLLRIEPANANFLRILDWFFPDAEFRSLGKNWLVLYSDFTFDVLSKSEHIDLRQTRAAYMMSLINKHAKNPVWPATLPGSILLTIENDVAFNSVLAWYARCIGSDFLTMQKRFKGCDQVTLYSNFDYSAHPYKTDAVITDAVDVIRAIKGEKDLNMPEPPKYGPVLTVIKGLFLKAGLSDKDVDEVLGKYASAPKGTPALPDFAIPVPPPKPKQAPVGYRHYDSKRYVPVHITHDPDSPYYIDDMD